jgi:Rrf2 family protein
MLDLAAGDNGHPISLRDVAQRQGISEKYLWQVVSPLKSAGLVASVAGAHGGYKLARSPAAITVFDILAALDGSQHMIPCTESSEICERSAGCVARKFWKGLEEVVAEYFKAASLQSLADQQKQMQSSRSLTYCI